MGLGIAYAGTQNETVGGVSLTVQHCYTLIILDIRIISTNLFFSLSSDAIISIVFEM